MTKTYSTYNLKKTLQTQKLKGQVANSAGGYSFPLDKWKMLDRFCILGSEGGTYYIKEQELTRQNAQSAEACIAEDGVRVIETIKSISDSGRAFRQNALLFVYALAAKTGDEKTRQYAFAPEQFNTIIRTGTHLLNFVGYCDQFGGWGRGQKRAIANWYNTKQINSLAYQAVKYQQRDGYSQRDVLRLAHPTPYDNAVFKWITKGLGDNSPSDFPPIIEGFELIKTANDAKAAAVLIHKFKLPREAVPTQFLDSKEVWSALLADMPMTAMIRNLAKMTSIGLLDAADEKNVILSNLADLEHIRRARVHPLTILSALKVYQQGHGERGSLKWNAVPNIVDALDEAFYTSFRTVTPTGKRIMMALDISSSMTAAGIAGMSYLTARTASAAMALITANVEKDYQFVGFHTNIIPLDITPKRRLDDVVRYINQLGFGGTDCAQPMIYAQKNKLSIDSFIVYTDSETYAGRIHPHQALKAYREYSGINAKSVIVGMTANSFSIADPSDDGMMDVVGMDSSVPQVISDFIS